MSDPWGPIDDPFSEAAPLLEPRDDAPADYGAGANANTGEVPGDAEPTLEDRIGTLEEAVADISDMLTLSPGGPWVWHMLEPDARRKLATELVKWVTWLSDRYLAHLSQETVLKLPSRWFTNPVVVEMMTALYVGYISVYSTQKRNPSVALVEWHERGLWPTIQRLKDLKLITKEGVLATAVYTVPTDADAVDFLADDEPAAEETGATS